MKNKGVLKGAIFVALAASCYGMLATFVKIAYQENFTTAEVTSSQFVLGIIGLFILTVLASQKKGTKKIKVRPKDIKSLLLAGTSLGGTSLFYYLGVQYIDVSIAIILLMQSVWFSVVLEAIIDRKFPERRKIFAAILVLIGTVLATNIINSDVHINTLGIFWGLLAACSYTVTMLASNRIATYVPAYKKSLIMLLGGSVIVFPFLFFNQVGPYHFESMQNLYVQLSGSLPDLRAYDFTIFYKYGLILALFGTIIPPILFNIGFPKAGLGLGSIVSSLELPVSVSMAYFLLSEKIVLIQWVGILLILLAIVWMNLPKKNEKEKQMENIQ